MTKQRAQEIGKLETDRSILVVDDDYYLRQTIQLMLEEEGFQVRGAANGEEAVASVWSQQPALIILDMVLPLMNGIEVAAQVRSRYGELVPFVLLTADGHAEEKSHRIGAVAYLRKPFDFDDLIEIILRVLEK